MINDNAILYAIYFWGTKKVQLMEFYVKKIMKRILGCTKEFVHFKFITCSIVLNTT